MELTDAHKARNARVLRIMAQQGPVTTEQAYAQYDRIRRQSQKRGQNAQPLSNEQLQASATHDKSRALIQATDALTVRLNDNEKTSAS